MFLFLKFFLLQVLCNKTGIFLALKNIGEIIRINPFQVRKTTISTTFYYHIKVSRVPLQIGHMTSLHGGSFEMTLTVTWPCHDCIVIYYIRVARLKNSVLPLSPVHRRIPELSDKTSFRFSAQY